MEILCVYCGDLFEASPRHKNQIACKKPACQRAKKAEWQKHKMFGLGVGPQQLTDIIAKQLKNRLF